MLRYTKNSKKIRQENKQKNKNKFKENIIKYINIKNIKIIIKKNNFKY